MAQMLLGAFMDPSAAEQAIRELEYQGYTPADISVITQQQDYYPRMEKPNDVMARSATTGATAGGALGGLAGLLAGVGVVPVIAGLFVGGPVAMALGIVGAAAITVSGLVTGAAAGGLIGALVGLGLPHQTAEVYNQVINAGGVVVGLSVMAGNDEAAQEVLERHGASSIGLVDVYDSQPAASQPAVRHELVFGERIGDDDIR